MAKPNKNQLEVLDYLSTQIEYWKKTNDINSSTHHGDMEEEFWKIEELMDNKDKDIIIDSLCDILATIRKV